MAVEQYGARLLGDGQEEGLEDLLRALRTTGNPQPTDILGFPPIDQLLELFRFYQAAVPARFAGWTSSEPHGADYGDDGFEQEVGPGPPYYGNRTALKSRPPIIEVTSTRSASGKTTLLYHLTALALLPSTHGGKASSVIWIDTDGRFSALHLSRVISEISNKQSSKPGPQDRDALASSVLSHLYIIKPASSISLLAYLKQLSSHLLSPSNPSRHKPLGLVVLDSATAFQHQDRLDAELARLSNPALKSAGQPSRTNEIISALHNLETHFSCTVILTTISQNPASSRPSKATLPSGLSSEPLAISPWTSFATLTLHLSRLPVTQFAPRMSVDECLRDRSKRQEAVSKSRVRVGVDLAGAASEMWPTGVRDKVMALEGRGTFVIQLGGGGFALEVGGG